MQSDRNGTAVAVFDIGGTWFRWGLYEGAHGLSEARRIPAINYLRNPGLSAADLQGALLKFITQRVDDIRDEGHDDIRTVCIALGAPINAHDMTALGSGPLWGPTAQPFHLGDQLRKAMPGIEWVVVNDVTALLAPYMEGECVYRKTMLITVSSGIGSRLYDHGTQRIPYDSKHGIQGEIGHLVYPFELDGHLINRRCECGGWNHLNAFTSGRGIIQTLRELPALSTRYSAALGKSPEEWNCGSDDDRLQRFEAAIEQGNWPAIELLQAFVTPLARILAVTLALDPDIDRIVLTGGVVQGLGRHYKEALHQVSAADGLYQITPRDPDYLERRLYWNDTDDLAGLRGAGIYALRAAHAATQPTGMRNAISN